MACGKLNTKENLNVFTFSSESGQGHFMKGGGVQEVPNVVI